MQFGLAEIIGTAGVVLATGVGIVQIWFAYVQVRNTKKDSPQTIKSNENETNDKSKQDVLIRRAVSHQLQGNLYEAKSLIERAKTIPIENSQLLKLEQQLNAELTKPYVNKVSGKVIEKRLFEEIEDAMELRNVSGAWSNCSELYYPSKELDTYKSKGCISIPATAFATVFSTIVEAILYLFSRKFSFLAIFVFTGLIYLLLKWFNF